MTGPLPARRDVLAMAAGTLALPMVTASAHAAVSASTPFGPGRDQDFDSDWRFMRGEVPGAEAVMFNDNPWRAIVLPHDWSIEDVPGGEAPRQLGPFDKRSRGGTDTAYTLGGEGWYRKRFTIGRLPVGSRVDLLFEGVNVESEVWLNGHSLGVNLYGYAPRSYDLTPYLVADGANLVAVRVRNVGQNSRWYAGSGIYRSVRLDILPGGSRIAPAGVVATTRSLVGRKAEVEVTTRIEGVGPTLELITRLRSDGGRIVAEARSRADANVTQQLILPAADLWSPASPTLYILETELRRGSVVRDHLRQSFGVRIVTIDARDGMRINGAPIRLRGACIHHDNGLLGACAFADADDRRVALLKARGFNAIRGAHNPSSRSFRAACDRHGLLLIEEAFDMWVVSKRKDDFSVHFADHWREALAAMVLAARNSPSVFMWSIGNEVPDRATPAGIEWCWKLANEIHRLDPTRPVTEGLNGVMGRTVTPSIASAPAGRAGRKDQASTVFLDVAGYNYGLPIIESDHTAYPDRVIYASETFPADAYDYLTLAERAPYMLGEFVWSGMDYLGEAGVGLNGQIAKGGLPFVIPQFPVVVSNCGDIDLIGDQKAQSRARDVIWGLSPIEIAVQTPIADGKLEYVSLWGWSDESPNWTWPNEVGRPLAVRIYTIGDRVELRLNGLAVGSTSLTSANKMRAEIMVPYAPGVIEAVAYREGRIIGRRRLETVSTPTSLRVKSEKATMKAGDHALAYVQIDVLDARGRLVPDAVSDIRLSIDGPAKLIGLGSGNPRAAGSLQAADAKTFAGRAIAILRSTGRPGAVRVEVSGTGLKGGAALVHMT